MTIEQKLNNFTVQPAKIAKTELTFSEQLHQKCARDFGKSETALLGYNLTKFAQLANKLQGIQPGLYIIGAETNVGKTTFMLNILLDLLQANTNVTCIYISLDDSWDAIISRLLANLSGIEINLVRTPRKLTLHLQGELVEAYERLDEWAKVRKLEVKDTNTIVNTQTIEGLVLYYIESYKCTNLALFIDGAHNLETQNINQLREENIERANFLKLLSDKYNIPVFATVEIRKRVSQLSTPRDFNLAPTYHDIMESSKFAYNAHVIWMLHPYNWQFFKKNNEVQVSLFFEKNKLSSFRDPLVLRLIKDQARFFEDNPTITY